MKAKVMTLSLTVAVVAVLAWSLSWQPVSAQQKGEKVQTSRYQVIGAGLVTAVLFDTETGRTWALTNGGNMDGPRGYGGDAEQEFAWAPITKFDDLDSYRRWVKDQQEKRQKRMEERYGKKDKDFRGEKVPDKEKK